MPPHLGETMVMPGAFGRVSKTRPYMNIIPMGKRPIQEYSSYPFLEPSPALPRDGVDLAMQGLAAIDVHDPLVVHGSTVNTTWPFDDGGLGKRKGFRKKLKKVVRKVKSAQKKAGKKVFGKKGYALVKKVAPIAAGAVAAGAIASHYGAFAAKKEAAKGILKKAAESTLKKKAKQNLLQRIAGRLRPALNRVLSTRERAEAAQDHEAEAREEYTEAAEAAASAPAGSPQQAPLAQRARAALSAAAAAHGEAQQAEGEAQQAEAQESRAEVAAARDVAVAETDDAEKNILTADNAILRTDAHLRRAQAASAKLRGPQKAAIDAEILGVKSNAAAVANILGKVKEMRRSFGRGLSLSALSKGLSGHHDLVNTGALHDAQDLISQVMGQARSAVEGVVQQVTGGSGNLAEKAAEVVEHAKAVAAKAEDVANAAEAAAGGAAPTPPNGAVPDGDEAQGAGAGITRGGAAAGGGGTFVLVGLAALALMAFGKGRRR